MTKNEEAYATWLNVLGSDPVRPDQGEHEVNVLRILATSQADSERFSRAYMDVLLALARETGHEAAKTMLTELVNAAIAHRVHYIHGLPMMIDGVDCSPDNVRHLMEQREIYRAMCPGQDVQR